MIQSDKEIIKIQQNILYSYNFNFIKIIDGKILISSTTIT